MKSREKFFVIFTITIIVLSTVCIIMDYVGATKLGETMDSYIKELYNESGEIKEKYSSGIEERIQGYMSTLSEEEQRETAVLLVHKDIFFEHILKVEQHDASITTLINVVFYSLIITIFVHTMLTLEYKSKKQYLISHIIMFVVYYIIIKLETVVAGFREANFLLDNTIPIMYLVFLTGNSIKNRKEILLLNATLVDAIVVANVLYTAITGTLDISWDFVFWIYLPIFVVESIVILIDKAIKPKTKETSKK